MDKFDEHEVCPACGNDPVESGLKWKPRFVAEVGVKNEINDPRIMGHTIPAHLLVSCGQCKYQMKRSCLNEV